MNVNFKRQAGMLFRHLLLRSILLCGLLASCSKEEAADLSLTETDELRLGAAITGITRATDAGFEIGDTLGIFITKWQDASARDTLKESGNYTDNVLFRLENLSNDWVAEYPVYFPSDDNKIDLYAYYPYRNPAFVSGTSLGVKVFANQSVSNHYTRSDFMTTKTLGVSRTPNKVPLIFDHRLSQMVFILKPGAGFSVADLLPARLKIINAITDATFDLRDSLPVAGSVRSDIIPAGSWTAGVESLTGMKAILIPQELNPDTYVEITLGSRRFTYKPASVHLNPGCSRVFTITVNNTGLDITTEINPWDNCPPVNGDAYEEFDLDTIVTMVTTKLNPFFIVDKQGDILVDWGDGSIEKNVFTHLYKDQNSFHRIKFLGLTNSLLYLRCRGNGLTHLDVTKCTILTNLRCDNNQLTNLDFSKNRELEYLYCHDNKLSELDLRNNKALIALICYNNLLLDLNIGQNLKLETLNCSGNPFITNQAILTALANSLPERPDNSMGVLAINDSTSMTWIQSICNSKNWGIR